jgi:hypothetical protein
MDTRTDAIEALRFAWQMHIPGVPAPADNYLGIWAHYDNGNGLALEAIEITAESLRKITVHKPAAYCWNILKNLIDKRLRETQCQPN